MMMPVAGWVCFFTRIGGRFDGLNHYVRIQQLGANWWLDGNGQVGSRVHAHARCLQANGPSTIGPESMVTSPQRTVIAPVPGAAASDQSCFLTYLAGKWSSSQGAFITSTAQGWTLSASAIPGAVRAGARCAHLSPAGGNSWNATAGVTNLGTANNRACFLTGVRGPFASTFHIVEITKPNTDWLLNGISGPMIPGPHSARAVCVPD
jgi:hypothetical protein